MKILFIGNTATRARYECGVKGDGASETLTFDLAAVQDGFDLTACAAYLLLAGKTESYGDKIELATETDGERVIATYVLPAKVTVLGAVNASLEFDGADGEVWQTKIFDIVFAPYTNWSEKVVTGYPEILENIEATANEAKATADATAELVGTFDERITVLEGDVESLLGKDFSNLTDTIHKIETDAETETAERKAGDEALKEALEAETEARAEADAELDKRLTTLENTSFDGLADAVHSNTEMAREALKTANQATDDLAQEIKDRESACEALQTAISDASDALDKSIEETETRLTEALNATESELRKAIDEETEARKTADEALTASVESEAQLRAEADAALTQSIAEETAARETADEALTASIDSAAASLISSIDAETEARKEADEKLSTAIDEAEIAAVETAKEYADDITLSITESEDTYVFTFTLSNGSKTLASESIDLPLEEMIISGHYDAASKQIVLILRTGESISFSVSDLVEGLVNGSDLDEAVTGLEAKIASALDEAKEYADEAVKAEEAAREESEGALSEAIATAQSAADKAQETADGKIDEATADGLYDALGAADGAESAAKAYTDAELTSYITATDAANAYQPIGDYATKSEADALDGRLTDAEKDIEDLKAGVTVDLSDYYTKEQTDALIADRMSLDDVDAIFE